MPFILKAVSGGAIRRTGQKRDNRGVILYGLDQAGASPDVIDELKELPGLEEVSREQAQRDHNLEPPFAIVEREAFEMYVSDRVGVCAGGFEGLLQHIRSTQNTVEFNAEQDPDINGPYVRVIGPDSTDKLLSGAELNKAPLLPLGRVFRAVYNFLSGGKT